MDVRDYLRILRRQWLLVATCALLALGVAGVVTLVATPVYRSDAQLFVQSTTDPAAQANSLLQGSQFSQQSVQSYTRIVTSPEVLQPVIDQLELDTTVDELDDQVTASAPIDTVLLDISVEDPSPARAQAIAAAVTTQLSTFVRELERPEGGDTSPVVLKVTRPAELPTDPVSPRSRLNLALGLLVGLAVGVGAAVLRETLDTSVKGPQQLRDEVGVTTLGVIGFDTEARRAPLVVQVDPHSPRAEAFRQLRTNLQFVDVDSAPRTVLVTSPLPEEGKSTTAANLAITLAESGMSVALVEADLRRPKVVSYLGLEGAVGLTDVLIGRVELDDVLQEWGDGRLLVLPGGATPPNPSELLGSEQMKELLARLRGMVDMVVVDTSPTLPVADAAVLASAVDGVLLVVRSNRTSVEQVQHAVRNIEAVGARILGAVITMAPTKGVDAYGYGYGYGYGYAPASPPSALAGGRPAGQSQDQAQGSGTSTAAAATAPAGASSAGAGATTVTAARPGAGTSAAAGSSPVRRSFLARLRGRGAASTPPATPRRAAPLHSDGRGAEAGRSNGTTGAAGHSPSDPSAPSSASTDGPGWTRVSEESTPPRPPSGL